MEDSTNMTTKTAFEILSGFPQSNEEVLHFGGQEHFSEGYLVRFWLPAGTSWVGNFKRGYTELTGVFTLSGSAELLVFAAGSGYLVNLENKSVTREFGSGYCQNLFQANIDQIVLSNLTSIIVIERDGQLWESERISWDGIKDLKISGDVVSGLSFDPMSTEKWIRFTVNLKTHAVTGGGYGEYKITKGPE